MPANGDNQQEAIASIVQSLMSAEAQFEQRKLDDLLKQPVATGQQPGQVGPVLLFFLNFSVVYKVPFQVCWERLSSYEEGKNIKWKKRESESNIFFPKILRL